MLTLITGPDHKVFRTELLSRMMERVSRGKGEQYLIVPEQYSFDTERLLCALGGDQTSRFAEVLSFSRLAGRVECACGGTSLLWLDHGGRLLTAAQAVEQIHSRLKLYAGVCRKTEFLESLVTAVDEFGSYGVSPQQFSEFAKLHTGQFAQKLEEIGLLYESYLSVCTQAKEPSQRLQNLRDTLLREDYASDKEYYVCGFTDFTLLEREILEALILSAENVTVALPQETSGGREVFPSARDTSEHLKKFCNKMNAPFAEVKTEFDTNVPADLLHLQHRISQTGQSAFQGDADAVRIRTFSTMEEECRFAADEILRLRAAGVRYRDISVACSDLNGYAEILPAVLERCGIPYHIASKKMLTDNSGARILLSGLRAVAEGFDRDAVLDYIKCGATGLCDDACDQLENYARLWNIRGGGWLGVWTQHPVGIGRDWDDTHRQLLKQLNDWRESGLTPLILLREKLRGANNVGEMVKAVSEFAGRIHLAQRLQELSDNMFDLGEFDKAQQYSQIYEILMNCMEQMYLIMPDAVRSVEEFYNLFEKLLKQYSVGTIPAAVEQISVGELSSFRGKSVRHLLVLGCSEGVFPHCTHGTGLFTEEERRTLIGQGVSMAPLRSDVLDRELGNIFLTLRSATESVYMSCSGKEPSYLLTRIQNDFGTGLPAEDSIVLLDRKELAALLVRSNQTSADLSLVEEMEVLRRQANSRFGTICAENVSKLYGKEISLSASRIDKFASCRFAYFLRYGLKADPLKTAEFDASEFGTFVHEVLEKTAREVMAQGGFRKVEEARLLDIANRFMDQYEESNLRDLTLQGERFRYLFRRNREEALAVVRDLGAELRKSDFEPVAFELKFDREGPMDAISVQGTEAKASVKGFVDRVDIYQHGDAAYVRVVDYKTGHKDFDYADLSVGEGMQMLIYLFALHRNGEKVFGKKLQPCGVLYHPSRLDLPHFKQRPSDDQAEKEQTSARRRKGLVLDDDLVLSAMEHFDGNPDYLPFKVNKDSVRGGDLANRQEMRDLEAHVFEKLRQITDGISSGIVDPNPIVRGSMNSACTYCDYADVCQRGFATHENRPMRQMKNREFFAEIQGKGERSDG